MEIEYRSKIEIEGQVRIVNVGEYDCCACCAPHVNNTGEIGLIKILDFILKTVNVTVKEKNDFLNQFIDDLITSQTFFKSS